MCKNRRFLPFMMLVLIGCIAYAPLIPQLGFYRDDWYQLWALNTLGPKSIITLFSIDRPAMGYLYAATSALFGSNPLPWHLYSLTLRILDGIILLAILRRLWPEKDRLAFATALLSLIYPGFLQQPNANTFSNHLFTYTMALISIWLTTLALQTESRKKRTIYTGLALLTALLYLPIYEYMIGLEGLRLGILWLLIGRNQTLTSKQRLKKLAISWLPYILLILGFLGWRFFLFESERVTTNINSQIGEFMNRPKRALARIVLESFKDPLETIILGWFVPTYDLLNSADSLELIKGTLYAIAAATLVALLVIFPNQDSTDDTFDDRYKTQEREGIWLGIVASVCAIFPVVLFGRDVRWDSGFDRYTLQVTSGAALIVACFLWFSVKPSVRSGILIGLTILSILTHYLNAVVWRDAWANQKLFWWQMSWRAPQLEPGTVLLVQVANNNFFEDYEIWGPANLIYGKESATPKVFAEVLNNQTLDYTRVGARPWRSMRILIVFQRDYNHTLAATMPSTTSCLHVLDRTSLELPQGTDPRIQIVADFSRLEQIQAWATPASVPVEVFGPEPEHSWCYYYQKASLARQQGEWETIAQLGDEALAKGLKPYDKTEWMPFLMGYIVTRDYTKAGQLAEIIRSEEITRHRLCDEANLSLFPSEESSQIFTDLLCEFH